MRKHHGEEIAAARRAAAGLGDARGRRRAVMAVGDIERRQGIEGARQRRDGRVVADHPELMPHAVVGGDVDTRASPAAARASMASICGAVG